MPEGLWLILVINKYFYIYVYITKHDSLYNICPHNSIFVNVFDTWFMDNLYISRQFASFWRLL